MQQQLPGITLDSTAGRGAGGGDPLRPPHIEAPIDVLLGPQSWTLPPPLNDQYNNSSSRLAGGSLSLMSSGPFAEEGFGPSSAVDSPMTLMPTVGGSSSSSRPSAALQSAFAEQISPSTMNAVMQMSQFRGGTGASPSINNIDPFSAGGADDSHLMQQQQQLLLQQQQQHHQQQQLRLPRRTVEEYHHGMEIDTSRHSGDDRGPDSGMSPLYSTGRGSVHGDEQHDEVPASERDEEYTEEDANSVASGMSVARYAAAVGGRGGRVSCCTDSSTSTSSTTTSTADCRQYLLVLYSEH
jgi:hypothetical protein